MLVAWAAAYLVRRYGPRLGLVDRPGDRKVHTRPTPTGGGLAIWLGIVGPLALGQLLLWYLLGVHDGRAAEAWLRLPAFVEPHLPGLLEQSGKLWTLLAGGTVLMVLGLVDDRRGLGWKLRLGVETLVALVLVLFGWRLSLFIEAPLLTGLLSVLWIVGLVNSFNMLDNMDGLSAGVAAIAAVMLSAVMLLAGDPVTHQPQLFVGGFLLVLAGALVGFLWHNRPPAKLFMGDAGAYLVGYLLAAASLRATFTGGDAPVHAILAPLCVLAVPLYDTVTVMLIRLRSGRSPFVGDKSHFSHRLVELGMTKTQAVLTIYLATATCGLGALLLHQVRASGACIILLLVGSVLVLVGILETAGRRKDEV
ncbi:MAG: undecaprenyl-phosphate alpha-N-acetylglucosaminyl 1-phosphate transferase [Planctomycetes bacterium RBG_16_64_12]|nr:MAG: undecaprenyl-phosphate alpha-N-acetylglucosaminyl 1-phosphate transferase [Planctomycetes bacterium RBG_16_64_12]